MKKPRLKGLGIMFGATCEPATEHWRARADVVLPLLHPALRGVDSDVLTAPCAVLFDAGRALDWPLLMIEDEWGQARQLAALEKCVTTVLEPLSREVTNCENVASILLRLIRPYEWFATNPVIRAAEIISSLHVSGQSDASISERLASYNKEMNRAAIAASKTRDAFEMTRFIKALTEDRCHS